ncbi:MAG: sporulation protein YqfD [Mollicutes bacterium]|nr:sporulation protein YqfD [Mollicutes bacterium]
MENKFKSFLENKIIIRIEGKNINRFLKRLIKHKVELLDVKYINQNKVDIKIKANDYPKIERLKSIYDISIVDAEGLIKIKALLKINSVLIITFLMGIILLIFLANIIFDIEVIHTNKELRTLLLNELKESGIDRLKLQKSYQDIQKIKKRILEEYKDQIEWLEIEKVGTKYLVRVEERKLSPPIEEIPNRHIVAKKNAVIKKIEAQSGEIVREINDYVKAGDVIISGEIKLYDQVKKVIGAKGKVYGEVWYQTKVTYPLTRRIETPLSNFKKVLVINFLNTRIELFNFKSFKEKKIEVNNIFKNSLLPISLDLEKQQEMKVIEEINTIDEAIAKAAEKGKEKIEERLKEDEYIISQKNLKIDVKNSTIIVEMFYVVYEDITSYQKIENIIENNEE